MSISYSGGAYLGPREISYLFVDGASLHGRIENLSKKFLGGQQFEVDFVKLRYGHSKCFYYDAIPVRNESEPEVDYLNRTAPQRGRHQRAAKADGVHVYEGDARMRRKQLQQKKVDVMIAVDLMHHTFRRNMHKATLLTGDGDFRPLVDAVVREGMELSLWYPPGETSPDILDAADIRTPLGVQSIRNILTHESVLRFDLPIAESVTDLPGAIVRSWGDPGKQQELRRADDVLWAVRCWDHLNNYCIRHRDPEVIKAMCAEYPQFFDLPPDLFPL